ncbi:Nitrite transporter NirC [Thalassocella blandensis]|nr:Nitrite transporter NirC [Thalassocella blandensis]
MGSTFAVALTLVMFAGAELFTGYTMCMTFGFLRKRITLLSSIKICVLVWFANLIGSLILSLMY